MRPTEDLLRLTEQEGIVLEFRPLQPAYLGLYIREPGAPPHILLDTNLRKPSQVRLLRAIWAEELGHHFTTGGDWVKAPHDPTFDVLRKKAEIKALRWAVDFLVDGEELMRFWRRYPYVGPAAEHFVVPELFILEKLAWMRGYSKYAA